MPEVREKVEIIILKAHRQGAEKGDSRSEAPF
jgi:hypothetical protein